jgi:hypothetical protein
VTKDDDDGDDGDSNNNNNTEIVHNVYEINQQINSALLA